MHANGNQAMGPTACLHQVGHQADVTRYSDLHIDLTVVQFRFLFVLTKHFHVWKKRDPLTVIMSCALPFMAVLWQNKQKFKTDDRQIYMQMTVVDFILLGPRSDSEPLY